MAGAAGTPLSRKLGIQPGTTIHAIDAPEGYRLRLAPLPHGVTFVPRVSGTVDLFHVFATSASVMMQTLPRLRKQMRADAVVWSGLKLVVRTALR